ncbi:hypothetical protein E5Q_06383 [Mixia osmundae IAM 14324]|uniref:Uncharacterized protein n=1 Tax=Mixia osmundae (strain CBS 9802 / IAM 14324 / JCM 22182 / KY 12970) TaxID=764103 RepID=G7EA20_MIXOS|nr:hypothetical protein E5Q_06383 [Mixia osmundae IAM 14324]
MSISINCIFRYNFRVTTSPRSKKMTGTLKKNFFWHLPICFFSTCDVQLVHFKFNIHRDVLIHDYSEFLLHRVKFQTLIRTDFRFMISLGIKAIKTCLCPPCTFLSKVSIRYKLILRLVFVNGLNLTSYDTN